MCYSKNLLLMSLVCGQREAMHNAQGKESLQ